MTVTSYKKSHGGRPYGGGGRCVQVDDAADVRAHGVDGGVGAETCRVDSQLGGALIDHVPDDVDFHLGGGGRGEG